MLQLVPASRWGSLALLAPAALLLSACFESDGGGPSATPTPSVPAVTATRVRPTATVASPSPSPSPVAMPERPDRLGDYAHAIADFLTATGADASCPDDLLDAWEIPISPAQRCAGADTNGDGSIELVLVLAPPEQPEPAPGAALDRPVVVAVLGGPPGVWGVVYESPDVEDGGGLLTSTVEGGPEKLLLAVSDLNGIPGAEVAYRTDSCGAHTCFTTVEVIGWDGTAYVDLTPPEVMTSFADVALEDRDGDGTVEIVLHGGSIGSVGAGPTRTRTEVYRWDGAIWSLAETLNDPSEFLYHAIRDADDAFAAGDYAGAATLYESALADTALTEWKEGERLETEPYAIFRIALSRLALGEGDGYADSALVDATARSPGSLHGRLAAEFREAWLPAEDVSLGCAAALAFIQENADAFGAFWDFGYGNPPFEAESICPL